MKLYISGPSFSFDEICNKLKEYNVSCKIVKNRSVIKIDGGFPSLENGYEIEIYECTKVKFLEVATGLIDTFKLRCAFVKIPGEYMGCINNWPGMTCKTNCPGSSSHN